MDMFDEVFGVFFGKCLLKVLVEWDDFVLFFGCCLMSG